MKNQPETGPGRVSEEKRSRPQKFNASICPSPISSSRKTLGELLSPEAALGATLLLASAALASRRHPRS